MECDRAAMGRCLECAVRSGQHIDYGLITPLVPTLPSAVASITTPSVSREILPEVRDICVVGITSAPFQPPRI